MALDLFKLLGTIEVDNKKANNALDETSEKGEESESKLGKAFGAIGKGAVAVGKTIATGLAVGGAAFAGLAAKALNAAGELEQNMGGSEAVFGEYATKMQETAKTAFSNMGLSTSDYLATANKMGSLFKGAGFTQEEAMNRSAEAMQRAADVASIMGIDTASAMESIAGAAKGNFTMMDNLGVAMNDTALNAYALEKGINKTTQEMTQQEKIGLAMDMFLEKTADYAGNYAKENETLAGSLGTAKAALTNFLDGSGSVEDLVSSFGNLANVAVNSLQEILPRLSTGLTEIVNQLIPKIPPLLQKILPSIIQGASTLISGLASALPGLLSVVVNDLLPAAISAIQSVFTSVVTALPGLVGSIASALPTLIPLLISALVSMILTLCSSLPSIIQPIIDNLPMILESVIVGLLSALPQLVQGLISLVVALIPMIPEILNILIDSINVTFAEQWASTILDLIPVVLSGLVQVIVALAKALPGLLLSVVKVIGQSFIMAYNAITTVFKKISPWIKEKVVQPVVKFFTDLKDKAVSIFTGLKTKAAEIFNTIKEKISAPINSAKEKVQTAIQNMRDGVVSKINALRSKVSEIFNSVKEKMEKPIQKARDTIKGIVDKIKGFFSGMNISFPHIKLPHFSISPSGWSIGDLLKGSIPKLGIEWYAKAMENPLIMTKPTIFGYDAGTGKLMGGGEVPGGGGEVVSGVNTLMNMIQTAVAAQNEPVVKVLTAILNAIIGGNEDLLHALLADKTFSVGEREFARLVKKYA